MSSNTNDLKLPAAIKAASGTRDTRCNAAWFIEEVYKLNPAHNVLEKKALVLAEWEGFVKANFPQLMEEMKEEVYTEPSSLLYLV